MAPLVSSQKTLRVAWDEIREEESNNVLALAIQAVGLTMFNPCRAGVPWVLNDGCLHSETMAASSPRNSKGREKEEGRGATEITDRLKLV